MTGTIREKLAIQWQRNKRADSSLGCRKYETYFGRISKERLELRKESDKIGWGKPLQRQSLSPTNKLGKTGPMGNSRKKDTKLGEFGSHCKEQEKKKRPFTSCQKRKDCEGDGVLKVRSTSLNEAGRKR